MPGADTTDTDTTEAAEGQGGDNAVIQALRQTNRDLTKQVKELKDAEPTIRAQVQREVEITRLVNEAGYPKLAEVVAAQVEGDPTAEAVTAALEGLGLAPKAAEAAGEQEQPKQPEQTSADALAGVANLGQQVAAAASGAGGADLATRLAEAKSIEEVTALAAEGGFLQQ